MDYQNFKNWRGSRSLFADSFTILYQMKTPPFRSWTKEAAQKVAERLSLPFDDSMQDWPIEVVNPNDIDTYLEQYSSAGNSDEKFVLMEMIIQSLEEHPDESRLESNWDAVRTILIDNFEIHQFTIYYWADLKGGRNCDQWKMSDKLRQVWQSVVGN